MKTESFNLWNNFVGEEIPKITAYIPDEKKSDGAVVIFAGGGYAKRAPHEGAGYAEFLCENGITSFVVDYRVSPNRFPYPLLDARRGIQFVRFYAEKYGIDKNKIGVMGSSAGGHLAALCSTYFDEIESEEDDISKECFIPNAQILCYPVILLYKKGITHSGSGQNLLGEKCAELAEKLSPHNIVNEKTPQAFIWHTFADGGVNVINSLEYAKALRNDGKKCEMHIYPDGPHGLGIPEPDTKEKAHIRQWADSLIKWLKYIDFLK